MTRIGIVGGGPAGAICARVLAENGVDVTIFDKGKRPGGRLSTRAYQDVHFDHGAQFFTVRNETVRKRLVAWQDANVIAPWVGQEETLGTTTCDLPSRRPEQRWVGTPGMSALVAHVLRGLPCRYSTKVTRLRSVGGQIALDIESQASMQVDRVAITVPAPQAIPLLQDWPELAERAKTISYHPCWAVMAEFPEPFPGDWVSAVSHTSPVRRIGRNQTKPGRPPKEAWVIHASPEWSRSHLDDCHESVAAALLASAQELSKWKLLPSSLRSHRWLYALVEQPLGRAFLYESGVGVCGDGLLGGRIENALLSGMAMAEQLLSSLR